MVVLLWVAEWPNRMFMFNIPAWVFGVVIAAIQIVQYMGHKEWDLVLDLVLGIVVCGFVARQFGALTEYDWIPKVVGNRPRRARPQRQPKQSRTYAPGSPTVVTGPWQDPAASRDEERMNELLDKISLTGVDSLTERERAELNELRLRRRRTQ
jgi:hypothetical protein